MMNIALYGTKDDHDVCVALFNMMPELQYRLIRFSHMDNYDDFILSLSEDSYSMIVVLADGAAGMEAVIAARTLSPESAVIWLTDDEEFGAQSHRLGCTYFATKPITEHILSTAFRCYRESIS